MRIAFSRAIVGVIAAVTALFSLASVAHAQNAASDSLRATIKSEIMADPRSRTLTEAQIYTLVDSLAVQAMKQGTTAQNIAWRPYIPQQEQFVSGQTQSCGVDFLCTIDYAFGFLGGDYTIPVALLILCTLFIFIFSLMREHGHPHAQFANTPQ